MRSPAASTRSQPSSSLSAYHERVDVCALQERVGLLRVDADEEPTLTAGGHGHVAVDEERVPPNIRFSVTPRS